MPDLRERLRRIEATEPPDLWTSIEMRALEQRPELDPNVFPFRPRGSEWRRRLAAGFVAAAVFALAVVVAWNAFRPAPLPPPVGTLPEGWQRCTNGVLGYSIGFPGGWHTTDILIGTQDPAYACRWFSPSPFDVVDDQGRPQGNVVTEGWGYPLEVGIGERFDLALRNRLDPEAARILVQDELVVDGHRAVRLEYETLVDLIGEPGLHYEYLIELDPETTLIVHTTATGGIEGVYEENRAVVDDAVGTLRFASPIPGALPEGWELCTNDALGYSIGFPGEWHTTDILIGTQDPAYACQWFSPRPFDVVDDQGLPQGNVVTEGWGYPLEVRIGGPFEVSLQDRLDPELVRVLVNEELVVDGRRAVRLEYETLIDLIADTGLHYEYRIELDPETTLIVHTTATRGVDGVYEDNRTVVDRAVDTLRFDPIESA